MSVLERQHRISDTGAESRRSDSRLVFPPSPTAQGVVDGSWWPRTRDPAAELPGLIAAVTEPVGRGESDRAERRRLGRQAPANHDRRPAGGPPGLVRRRGAHDQGDRLRFLAAGPADDPTRHRNDPGLGLPGDRGGGRLRPRTYGPDHSASCTPVTLWSVPPPVGQSQREQREQVGRWETDGGRVQELT
jgi:hypothetical protein